jgi:tRNA(fMet)-specific endonuclease VapC
MWMLDTDTCSYVLRKRPASVKLQFDRVGPENLAISSVVLAELYYGAARHPRGPEIRAEVDDFVSRLRVIPWDEVAPDRYGSLRTALERSGTPIGCMDMLIAAHALALRATLVSNNARHFQNVPGLTLETWV